MPRLPPIFEREQLPEGKREVHDYLMKTRGKLSVGYATLLHSPEFVARVAHLGSFLRFDSCLPETVRELLSCTAAAELGDVNERLAHGRAAARLGVAQSVIDAITNKSALEGASGDEMLAVLCARELAREHQLSEATFQAAHKRLGSQGVVELIGTVGYYVLLAYLHNSTLVQGA